MMMIVQILYFYSALHGGNLLDTETYMLGSASNPAIVAACHAQAKAVSENPGVLLQLIPGTQRVESHCEVQPSPPGFIFN